MKRTRILLAALSLSVLAACGLQPASQFIPEVKPGEQLSEFDSLAGATVVTTSKDFTEQLILGKMLSLVLASKGAEVVDNTNAKGSVNARESLVRGDADVMWEYTGTGWVVYLGHVDGDANPDPGAGTGAEEKTVELGNAEEVYTAVAYEDLKKNGIVWSAPAPFNNTYAMAVTRADAEKYGLKSLNDIASLPPEQQTFCLESEFQNRGDGWPGMQEAYGFSVPSDNVSTMDAGIIYGQVGKSCLLGEVFDTDGRIISNDLVTLTDDEHYFPIYEPSVNIREPINDEYPQIAEMFAKIGAKLSTDTMRELNARVDVDGENPINVAQDWLTKEGFLKPEA